MTIGWRPRPRDTPTFCTTAVFHSTLQPWHWFHLFNPLSFTPQKRIMSVHFGHLYGLRWDFSLKTVFTLVNCSTAVMPHKVLFVWVLHCMRWWWWFALFFVPNIIVQKLQDKVFHHFSISGGLVWSKQPGAEQRSNRQNLNSRNISTSSESMTRHGGRWQQWALVRSLLCWTKLAW